MASFKFILLGLFAVAGPATCYVLRQNTTDGKSKVEGGEPICIEKVPYQVYLKYDDQYFCGGVLVRPDVVLTAAHCLSQVLNEISPLPLIVVAGTDKTTHDGENEPSNGKIEIEMKHAVMYPEYENDPDNSWEYDIAFIKLAEKFPMTKTIGVIPISLCKPAEGEQLLLTGIGMVDKHKLVPSPCLKAYTPKVVDCDEYLPESLLRSDYKPVFCHKCDLGCKSRSGDSGSPITDADGYLVGIHIADFEYFGVQVGVSVSYFSKWIHRLINKYV